MLATTTNTEILYPSKDTKDMTVSPQYSKFSSIGLNSIHFIASQVEYEMSHNIGHNWDGEEVS